VAPAGNKLGDTASPNTAEQPADVSSPQYAYGGFFSLSLSAAQAEEEVHNKRVSRGRALHLNARC
jgi:hypothetical protein